MNSTHTRSSLATEARSYLERRKGNREADGIGVILTTKNGCPDWVSDLTREAHKDGSTDILGHPGQGSMIPDDWRYEFVGNALSILEDHDDLDEAIEAADEWFAGAYEGYHHVTAWMHSRPGDRLAYVEEAAAERGPLTLGDACSLYDLCKAGMFLEVQEVWGLVVGSLDSHVA